MPVDAMLADDGSECPPLGGYGKQRPAQFLPFLFQALDAALQLADPPCVAVREIGLELDDKPCHKPQAPACHRRGQGQDANVEFLLSDDEPHPVTSLHLCSRLAPIVKDLVDELAHSVGGFPARRKRLADSDLDKHVDLRLDVRFEIPH